MSPPRGSTSHLCAPSLESEQKKCSSFHSLPGFLRFAASGNPGDKSINNSLARETECASQAGCVKSIHWFKYIEAFAVLMATIARENSWRAQRVIEAEGEDVDKCRIDF